MAVEEFRQHLRAAVNFHGESLRARRSVFLGDANALTQPVSMLKDIFRVLNEQFELPVPETPGRSVISGLMVKLPAGYQLSGTISEY